MNRRALQKNNEWALTKNLGGFVVGCFILSHSGRVPFRSTFCPNLAGILLLTLQDSNRIGFFTPVVVSAILSTFKYEREAFVEVLLDC